MKASITTDIINVITDTERELYAFELVDGFLDDEKFYKVISKEEVSWINGYINANDLTRVNDN